MLNKILVANRGEIALRILRACRDLGISSAIVCSEEDVDSYPVAYADDAVCIGPAPVTKSYLNIEEIISAAKRVGADAIHPGYGLLSENAEFAQSCSKAGFVFIGPSPECIKKMGNKSEARKTMMSCGVPVIPGTDGCVRSLEEAESFAQQSGYPLLIKASSGGGGRGMRTVHSAAELEDQVCAAQAEARSAFGNGDVYLEKLIKPSRHIEVQILVDNFGSAAALCERNCSVQRRHQKLIEEAPSPSLPSALRHKLEQAALTAAQAAGYSNAGTVEFLLDSQDNFYFIEMNTRIQVEHTITEEITGIDIVKEQIRIASDEPLSLPNGTMLEPHGHAIEFRINAEDPYDNFKPTPGIITLFNLPGGPGVRVESHIRIGSEISPFYDSLIAKLIVSGSCRSEAISRARRALDEFEIEGVHTTIPLHKAILKDDRFVAGDYSTDFINSIAEVPAQASSKR